MRANEQRDSGPSARAAVWRLAVAALLTLSFAPGSFFAQVLGAREPGPPAATTPDTSPGNEKAAGAARPNVLVIASDDHAAYVLGVDGDTQVRTPALDRLAGQGLYFRRAYANSPVCTASRQSLLTGRYPRTIGVTQLRTPLPASELTLAEMLAAAGYRTAAIGKMHFNSELTHGFQKRIDLADFRRLRAAAGLAPPGSPRDLPADAGPVLGLWRPFADPARVWLNSEVLPYAAAEADMPATFLAEQAIGWLAEQTGEEPFFLMVSFYEPHSPFHFPLEYRGRHDPAAFEVPPVDADDEPQVPAIFRDLSRSEKQGIIAAYYTSVEFLDASVGRVLAALDDEGLAETTLVVYLGDHGYMLGQHGRFEKHCSFEPAIRAPLMLRWPGRIPQGRQSAALVELVDLVPTILEACHIPIPPPVQGRSFWPLATAATVATDAHRAAVVVEYAENEEALIRTERYKLVYCTGRREREDGYTTGLPLPGRTIRLYDLEADPEERRDLAGRDDARIAALIDELLDDLLAHLVATARQPELLPRAGRLELIDFCLAPRDVSREEALGEAIEASP